MLSCLVKAPVSATEAMSISVVQTFQGTVDSPERQGPMDSGASLLATHKEKDSQENQV